MSRILVTGGAGFIGSQLGAALDRDGHEVILVDDMSDGHEDNLVVEGRRAGHFHLLDVRRPELAPLLDGVETVFQFAGPSSRPKCQSQPAYAYDNNVGGVANVLELSRRAGVRRVIFSSTSAVYENTKTTPFREDAEIAPDLIYAMTKQAAERLCAGVARTCGLDVIVARFFNVYGEHQDFHRVNPPFVSYLAREALHGRAPLLFNPSPAARDYVNVADVIDCLKLMRVAPKRYAGEAFNICSGQGWSVPQIVALYAQAIGRPIDPVYGDPGAFWDRFPALFEGPLPLERARIAAEVFKHSIGDPAKTRAEFGFEPRVSMEEGLRRLHVFAQAQAQAA